MAKQNLKLAKEIQWRDFHALVAHTRIVSLSYMFLADQGRMKTDNRTLGDSFKACRGEVADISL
jgi:hypothetical protein